MNSEVSTSTKKTKIVGIDLGTTNSVLAVLEGATAIVIPNSENMRTTPSIVAYNADGEALIGHFAKRQAIINPENTYFSVKRFIGCRYEDVKEEIQLLPYLINPDDTGRCKIYSPLLKREFSPEQISSVILKKLANDASIFLNQPVKDVVITVPAYFGDSQRLATKDAGELAGLNVVRILNEPTAAAVAYGLNKRINEVILIYDLGGGTFDLSILEVGDEIFEVLISLGDSRLGGDDFDNRIVKIIMDRFYQKHGKIVDLRADKQCLQRIIEAAEKAKIELSTNEKVIVDLPFVYTTSEGKSLDASTTLTRSEFITACSDLIDRCINPVNSIIIDAKLEKSMINEIVLVGGSTRMPIIRDSLFGIFQKKLNTSVDPDEVVGLGAAIQAGILAGEITDLILLDVTPLSLGIETQGKITTPMIKRNTAIPTKHKEIFSTGEDNQESVDINVVQGERLYVDDNKSLGCFKLGNLPLAKRGTLQIEVSFSIDSNGLLEVSAKEATSGTQQNIQIIGASTLSRSEVQKLLEEAKKNASNDDINRSYYEISLSLDAFCNSVEEINLDADGFFPNNSVIFLESDNNECAKPSVNIASFSNEYQLILFNELQFLYNEGFYQEIHNKFLEIDYAFDLLIDSWVDIRGIYSRKIVKSKELEYEKLLKLWENASFHDSEFNDQILEKKLDLNFMSLIAADLDLDLANLAFDELNFGNQVFSDFEQKNENQFTLQEENIQHGLINELLNNLIDFDDFYLNEKRETDNGKNDEGTIIDIELD